MSTVKKIFSLTSLLYAYAGIQTFLLIVGLVGTTIADEMMRQIFSAIMNILVIGGVAYFVTPTHRTPVDNV
jgi:hypothetical protein